MKFAHYQNICIRMHAHMHMLCTSHTCRIHSLFSLTVRTILKILIMYRCLVRIRMLTYWFVLVQHYRIARYEALKPELAYRQHELAHTCTLYRPPINTQPCHSAVG